MSRGPGKHQRAILAAVEERGACMVTHPDNTDSENAALRRAAYGLEKAGKIALRRDVHSHLVALPADTEQPDATVVGQDGKRYRVPATRTVGRVVDGAVRQFTVTEAGERMMSTRAIASVLGVSPATVLRDQAKKDGEQVDEFLSGD